MMSSLDATVAAVILAMGLVTYATKAGGLWVLERIELGERWEAGLETLPGAIVLSVVGVELASGGPAEWGAGLVVVAVVRKTDSVLVGLAAGVGAVVLFRTAVPG